jgi:hypothetical protein
MADERVHGAVKIVDPTTTSQQVGVDASGFITINLSPTDNTVIDNIDTSNAAIQTAVEIMDDWDETNRAAVNIIAGQVGVEGAAGAVTALTQRVTIATDDVVTVDLAGNNDVTITGAHVDDAGFTLGTSSGVMAMGFAGTQSVDANDAAALACETDGSLHIHDGGNVITVDGTVTADAGTGTFTVDLGANNDVTIEGGAVVGTDGSTGPANCLSVGGTDGSGNIQELTTDTDGHLQVDILSGAGTSTPTNPVADYDTAAGVTAGGVSNHDTADFGTDTRTVVKVIWSASVPMKVELQSVDNDVATTLAVGFSRAGETGEMTPPHHDYWTKSFTATGNAELFRLIRTNMDTSEPADVYSTIFYED